MDYYLHLIWKRNTRRNKEIRIKGIATPFVPSVHVFRTRFCPHIRDMEDTAERLAREVRTADTVRDDFDVRQLTGQEPEYQASVTLILQFVRIVSHSSFSSDNFLCCRCAFTTQENLINRQDSHAF